MAKHKQYLRPSARRPNDPTGSINPRNDCVEGTIHPKGEPIEGLGAPRAERTGISKAEVRKVVPKEPLKPTVLLRPHISSILGSAYVVAHEELHYLSSKVLEGKRLNDAEMRRYKILTESVAKLAREEREQTKLDAPEQLSDEELARVLKEAEEEGLLGG